MKRLSNPECNRLAHRGPILSLSPRLGNGRWASFQRGLVGLAMAGGLGACSSNSQAEYPAAPPPGVSAEPELAVPAPPGAIWRQDVVEALDAGLGYFLQRVDVEAELVGDSFVGFRVMALRPASWWQGIDLLPGDVVTQVNAMPIEQPVQAHKAFESLRSASELVVQYLRAGEARELHFEILSRPDSAPVQSASANETAHD